ncbi:MAG: PAS domain-containing sensor histidine kinase, partial [Candidatus Binatia bacterium]
MRDAGGLGPLLDTLGVGLYRVTPAGRIFHVSAALAEILGFPSREALLAADPAAIWPDERARTELMSRLDAEGFVRNVELELRRCDGGRIRVRTSLRTVRADDGTLVCEGVMEDVTEQRRALERVAASERRFRSLIEHSWDGVALVDAHARFVYVSPSVERILGYRPEELVGRESDEFVYDEHEPRRHAFDDFVRQPGMSVTADLRYRHRDGSVRWLETVRTNLLHDPAVGAIIANFRDVTERREAGEEERRARAAAEAANRAKDEFLATLSHELRSPLSAVLTWARLLRGGRLEPAKAKRALETIERNAQLQARLIEDMLDVSRIASGKLILELASVDLEASIRAAADGMRAAGDAKGIRMTISIGGEPLFVRGDGVRLQQVFGNLLSNAVKFTEEGGRVTIDARRSGSNAEVVVRDDGVGIEAGMLDRIFDRFQQGDSSLSRRHGGLGLGLAIARHLVEAHD